eukprot:TRINITY_DN66102_c5_g9_i1.p1 TRINITY_DN66102_c5_g9~~TRINITY_DN66102_c5_g9_i1.p1  ORF type:complete len:314 (-),score=31.88 TRINITY_DN66102_c5_g9_i1:417-1358(-)
MLRGACRLSCAAVRVAPLYHSPSDYYDLLIPNSPERLRFEDALQSRVELDSSSVSNLIDNYAKFRLPHALRDLWAAVQSSQQLSTLGTCLQFLHAFAGLHEWATFKKIRDFLLQPRVESTADEREAALLAVMEVYATTGQWLELQKLVRLHCTRDTSPVVYNKLVVIYGQNHMITEMNNMRALMRVRGVTPSNRALTALFAAYRRNGCDEDCIATKQEMDRYNVPPSAFAMSSMISFYGDRDDDEGLRACWEWMRQQPNLMLVAPEAEVPIHAKNVSRLAKAAVRYEMKDMEKEITEWRAINMRGVTWAKKQN